MEDDSQYRERRERLERLAQNLQALLGQTNEVLDNAAEEPTKARLSELDRLRTQMESAVHDYLDSSADLREYLRDQESKIEEAKRKAVMAEKRPRGERDEARIQELSEQLSTDLRLERVDNAIKELLDFLSDAEFFAANASTGRRRRLRSLQNAIDKALQK